MNPILIDLPEQFETARLQIRVPKPGDGEFVHQAIEASRHELKAWLPFARKERTVEEVEQDLRESYAKFLLREDIRMLLFEKRSSEFVGTSGLHQLDWTVPKCEVGYWIDSRKSGQGYITEAVNGLAGYAFEHIKAKRVYIRCDPMNLKSSLVAERAGFQLEGILKHDEWSVDGTTLTDTAIYAKTKK
ncbi:GNAT family N-acetyltransferase [Shouchella sp. JSM 1781072]|uniref:GNAT family N-acetyltransferase n=1 Tax=Bacillaceae TaxID=186817 RepID=UPI000C068B27|nr:MULTISPECIES: GNAT family N-acetyltransferase [Bacillaceae]UTR07522.1 GNAT family N-acetyltransferase [Alkalihalobacillus sp. LMS6]